VVQELKRAVEWTTAFLLLGSLEWSCRRSLPTLAGSPRGGPRSKCSMAAVFAFLGIWLISLVVALLAALQLGDFFAAGPEFDWVILGLMSFTVLAQLVFALAYAVTRRAAVLAVVALALAGVAIAPAALPRLIQAIADRATDPAAPGAANITIRLELVVPALLAVLVQWGLVRRRWLRAAAEDDFTRWPWIATALAGLVILNPFGLWFLQTTLQPSASDLTWQFTAVVTASVLAALLVMAWIECYIRDRILSRRLAASPSPQQPPATTAEAQI
jgi:hypothetical protein